MLAIYFKGRYHSEVSSPSDAIRVGKVLRKADPKASIEVRNDFGDRWSIREYTDLIERVTAIRIWDKDRAL